MSALAYSTCVYSTVEEDLDAALDGILSEALREEEGIFDEIDPITAKLGGRGDRQYHQLEVGRQEGLE